MDLHHHKLKLTAAFALFAISANAGPIKTARVTLSEPALPIPAGPYEPTWESMEDNWDVPDWLQDGKFGIFIHWGLYSVPAYRSEWYARNMYTNDGVIDWHKENFGKHSDFGYKDFIPMFKAECFDPQEWASLFKRSGARYVVPVAEHHDGFAMYDSELTRWDAKDMGPKRDLIGDLAAAIKDEGLVFGLSQHRIEHWSFMWPKKGLRTDLFDPAYADFYGPPQPPAEGTEGEQEVFEGRAAPQSAAFQEEWLRRNQELVDKYQPQLVFFDNGINPRELDPIKLRFAAYYYNRAAEWGKQVTLSTKRAAYLQATVKDYERGRPTQIAERFWQCDTSIGHNSWGWVDNFVYRNAGEMIRELVDVVSKNGTYLLNIAPRADGTISEEQQLRLLQMGEWLKINGEAIYGSRPWIKHGEGPTEEFVNSRSPERGITNAMLVTYTPQDMRFTTQRHEDGSYDLYAILFAWPASNTVNIQSLASGIDDLHGDITKVELLGSEQSVHFERSTSGLSVELPAWRPSDFANVLKISGLRNH